MKLDKAKSYCDTTLNNTLSGAKSNILELVFLISLVYKEAYLESFLINSLKLVPLFSAICI
jgi:hypothetical protein